MPKVSIIVPVYNVEKYLDRCVETLINQTLEDIEIILIDDGSTDNSGLKCLQWAKKDKRIVFVSKKNEKQGPSKNLGIKIAQSKYIMFVDSDDWIKLNMAQEMYNCISENDCDMVFCDKYGVFKGKEEIGRYSAWLTNITSIYETPDLLYKIGDTLCIKILKKSLFEENGIEQNTYYAEDTTALMKILIYAKKVYQIRKPMYYYFLDREGNTQTNPLKIYELSYNLDDFLDYFKKKGLYDEFKDELAIKVKKKIFNELIRIRSFCDKEQYSKLEKYYYEYLDFRFDGWRKDLKKILLLGSYNLRMMLHYCGDIYDLNLIRFTNSSISSIMSQPLNISEHTVSYSNSYKKSSVLNDLNKNLLDKIKKDSGNIDYILIDFLEERYPVAKAENTYVTVSEVFEELKPQLNIKDFAVLDEKERFEIWKEKCLEFILLLKQYFKPEQIILVETKLMERYGTDESNSIFKEYENIDDIKYINSYIQKCYEFFKENFKGIRVIPLESNELNFTDHLFAYGCYPYHMNIYYYSELADKIRKYLC